MVAIIMESVPVGLRGELTRWMLELKSGVFLGTLSARVREKLWQKICSESRGGPCIIVWSAQCEQGYKMEFWGAPSRVPTFWEGLQLLTKPIKH